jgi:oligopeptide transport system substrate-binding protein
VKRKSLSLIALLMAVMLISITFSGCASEQVQSGNQTQSQQTTGAKTPQVLTFSIIAEVPTLDPQKENSMPSMEVSSAIHEGLVRMHDGKIQPGMAEKWEISTDGKTYTYHLRDAKWSDGQPVTAQDFEYGIKRLLDPATASDYAFAGFCILNGYEYNSKKITDPNLVGVKALDAKTLQITLVSPAPYFEGYTNQASFYPSRKDLVEKYGKDFALEAGNNAYNGPFILKEWTHEQGLVLEKNPNYWNADAVKLDTVNINVVANTDTALSMYEDGELDFVNVPMALVEQYTGKSKVYMNGAIDWLRINLNTAGKPWFGNLDFREALNYGLDREDYVKTVTKGLYFPYTRLTLPMVAGAGGGKYTEECPINVLPTKADPAKAKDFLAKAMTALNITDPKTITVEIKTSDADNDRRMAEFIQDQWTRNLGITVSIKLVTYKQKLQDDTSKQYETVYNGWMPDYDDPMTYLELFESKNSQNSTGWSNADYDRLVEGARAEPDKMKRQNMLWDAEKILCEECPFVPLQCRQVAYLCKDNVKGVSRYFIGSDLDFVYAYKE